MKYQVLGPLRVTDHDGAGMISARKMAVVLAALLVRANQPVATKELITEVWDDNPPARAMSAMHVYISQLRKFLSRPGQAQSPIVTQAPGYLLPLNADDLDCLVFQRLVRQGRGLLVRKQCEEACAVFDEALGLWRGPALSTLATGPIVRGFVTSVAEVRLECIEMHIEASFMLGRHRQLVSNLYSLIADYPLHEVFYSQLMRALHSSGRRGDALSVYHTAREVLDRELGLEPSLKLRELQRAVLVA
jgi:SARP family transcriptional regulator, regulator of embCAB operon